MKIQSNKSTCSNWTFKDRSCKLYPEQPKLSRKEKSNVYSVKLCSDLNTNLSLQLVQFFKSSWKNKTLLCSISTKPTTITVTSVKQTHCSSTLPFTHLPEKRRAKLFSRNRLFCTKAQRPMIFKTL